MMGRILKLMAKSSYNLHLLIPKENEDYIKYGKNYELH